jgi:hypothetical protein
MPRDLYNEGRVTGYSSYELYVKHALSEFPNEEPASEREWLAAQLARGVSMILKVPVDQTPGYHRLAFKLPEKSKLIAANTIVGSLFLGSCEFDGSWATNVTDYGLLIDNSNISTVVTTQEAETLPYQAQHELGNARNTPRPNELTDKVATEAQKLQVLNYMKIQDGLVLQGGVWSNTSTGNPEHDFSPDYNAKPCVVLTLSGQVKQEFYILLTGFTDHTIISGISGIDEGSTQKIAPQDGDFLGPESFPWANKITFMTPPVYPYLIRKYFQSGHEGRRLINNTDSGTDRKDNLRIDHDDDDINTTFTSSYIYSADGVSVVGPTEPGGDITIASKIKDSDNAANKYIEVTQKHSDKSHIEDATVLKHSTILAGNGISYQPPKTHGGDVHISSISKSTNNYLKITQNSYSSSSDASETTSTFTASPINASGNNIKVTTPANPGDAITVSSSLTGGYLIDVTGNNGDLTISLSKDKFDTTINKNFDTNIKPIIDGLNKLLKVMGIDGGTFDKNGNLVWNSENNTIINGGGKFALGNLNVTSNSRKIVTHTGNAGDDLKVQ